MTKTHRMFNHHKHGDGKKLARLLRDIESQTTKLHEAVAVASTPPPPVVDPSALRAKIEALLDDVFAALTNKAPSPTPTPSPTGGTASGAPSTLPNPPANASSIAWPSFQGDTTFVGTSSSNVSVYYDGVLGDEALQNARDLLADADRIVELNNTIFGRDAHRAPPVNVILFAMGATDGTGGADHLGCTFKDGGNIEVCVSYGDSARCSGLFEAELCECAMNGQLCGTSTGEALSRWCAAVVSDNALADFATASTWADGLANWVDVVDSTDQNPDSIGCGMAFISYLLHRGATLPAIAQMMVRLGDDGTFADLYAALKMGTASLAWPTFVAAARAVISNAAIISDDPFDQVKLAMTKDHSHV